MTADLSMDLFAAGLEDRTPDWLKLTPKRSPLDLRALEQMSLGELLFAVLEMPIARM